MQKDLIDRQMAVNVAIKAVDDWEGRTNLWRNEIIEKRINAMPPAQPEPPWIPCEEEMPKEKDAGVLQKIGINKKSDNVLVTIDINNVKGVEVACTWDGMWKWDGMFAFPKWKVIAWMPFPAPYQGGEKE